MTRPPYHRVNPTRPRPGRVPKQRSAPPPTSTSGKSSKGGWCGPTLIAAVLVLGVSLLLVPLATRVWTTEIVPAANRVHFGDGLVVALALAGFGLYIAVSLLTTRRPISPAGSAPSEGWGAVRSEVSVLDVARGEPRSEGTAAGVPTSPGPTPAATTTAVAVPRGAAADGPGAFYLSPSSAPSGGGRAAGRCVTPGGAA